MRRILVIGSSLPGDKHGGGVVKDEVLQSLPKDSYICYALAPLSINQDELLPLSLHDVPLLIKRLYPDPMFRGARFYIPFLRFFGLRFISKIRIKQIVKFALKYRVNFIWGELQGDSIVLVESVSKKLNIPFAGTVWDDPEGWLDDGGYDRLSRRYIWKKFKSALKSAKSLSTSGEAMKKEYKELYGVDSVILRHGFDNPAVLTKKEVVNGSIKIGFAGSVYGKETWSAFLSAVENYNSSNKQKIKIVAFGNDQFPIIHSTVEIENRGRRNLEEVLKGISETDFCYLPYWFEKEKRKHCELSFPNKFETYIAAGRPVFYHGPEYAGIKTTIENYGVGISVHTLNSDEICGALSSFIRNVSARIIMEKNAEEAFNMEFNKEKMLRNFNKLVNGG